MLEIFPKFVFSALTYKLSLSTCVEDEFVCNDGSCISLEKRCDLKKDCPDASDEYGCNKALIPDGYLNYLPPEGHETDTLMVDLVVNINGITEVYIDHHS